ncbi:uncharacterized protein AB675_10167 [Cyphellophora attinorum]|uniref:Uncharacterized protein n=1 Tax=Cyphellophora attinorum TaxID=1664694 RepID=A0A0N1H265_9EURO|nr:uncharacterized protein AB675_10167 [Phialophora attinorum]KPI35210.1 hypothetical protein AB675_10167 [Phialophora attinorum]
MSPSCTSITAAAAIGLLLFAQPCPAPLLAIPILAGGLSTGIAAAGLATGVVGAGAAVGSLINDINNNDKKKRQVNDATSIWESMNLCAQYITTSGQVTVSSGRGIIQADNCPEICGDAIAAYNSAPRLAEMDKMFGTIQWNRGTIIVDTNGVNAGPPGQRNSNNQGSGRGSNDRNLLGDLATGNRQAAGADIAGARDGFNFKA